VVTEPARTAVGPGLGHERAPAEWPGQVAGNGCVTIVGGLVTGLGECLLKVVMG
jgi:hypothetical protein